MAEDKARISSRVSNGFLGAGVTTCWPEADLPDTDMVDLGLGDDGWWDIGFPDMDMLDSGVVLLIVLDVG